MMWRLAILAFCVALGSTQTAEKGNLDDLIDDVFAKSPAQPQDIPNEKPCNGGKGECVPYYLCVDGKINTDGSDLLDIRLGEDGAEPTECVDYFEQCCAIEGIRKELPPDTIPPGYESDGKGGVRPIPPPITNQQGPGGSVGPGGGSVQPPPVNPGNHKCGIRNVEGVGFRITGATQGESEYGEFPWMVAILKEETAGEQLLNVYQCGGSMINRNVILTAAHCVNGKAPNTLKVRAGEWDTQTKNELFPHSDYDVKEVVVHPEFYKGGLHNDVALLFLTKEVEDQPHIATVCLPPQNHVFDGSRCFASGWGKDVFGKEGKYQVILKKIELPIVPHPKCQEDFRQTRLGKRFQLHKSFICAGGEPGKDTCKGDGGSPLVCPAPGKPGAYYQAGIVAWGIGCGEQGTPGAYANVALFRNWIDQQVSAKGYKPSSYTA